MRSILEEIGSGAQTVTEAELGAIAARAGLRPPRRQVPRRDPDRRMRYLDAEFELADGTVLVVEVDGIHHRDVLQQGDDLNRQNNAVISGRVVLRFASLTIRYDGDAVVERLRRIDHAHS